MKKSFFAVILFAVLFLFSCEESVSQPRPFSFSEVSLLHEPHPNPEVPEPSYPLSVELKELGNPLRERFSWNNIAISPHDLEIYGGYLHFGSGEYTDNPGSVDMYGYSFENEKWELLSVLEEEAVLRFTRIGDELYTTGIDPTEDWSLGNYYVFREGLWEKNRVIPGGVHTFDVAEFRGEKYFAIGTRNTTNCVVRETVEGEFLRIPFVDREGKDLVFEPSNPETCRVYDLFVLDGRLFAMKKPNEVYVFNGSEFEFFALWEDFETFHAGYNGGTENKVVFRDKLFVAGGWFYRFENAGKGERIFVTENHNAVDVYATEQEIFVLSCFRKENGLFQIEVYFSESGDETDFRKFLSFEYPVPAVSFAVGQDSCYFGMFYRNALQSEETDPNAEKYNGMILQAEYIYLQ